MTRRRVGVLGFVVTVMLVALTAVGGPSRAQLLPPPPTVPAPPIEGNPLADILGPGVTGNCDAVSVVFALVGPIASAQLPEELQVLVAELEPYIGTALVVCGFLVTPPSGIVCEADSGVTNLLVPLGLPVAAPTAAQVAHDTIAGIENAFLRIGIDIGRGTSEQMAAALGCEVGVAAPLPPAAAVPRPPSVPSSPATPPQVLAAIGAFAAPSDVAPRVPGRIASPQPLPPDVVRPIVNVPHGIFRYPAAFLVPLALLIGLAIAGRAFLQPARTRARRR